MTARALGVALLGLLSLGAAACRAGAGDACRCASDCRSGLECYAEGKKNLDGDQCFGSDVVGVCVSSQSVDSESGPTNLTEAPIRDDLHSKRDLGGSASDTATSSTGSTDSASASGTSSTTDATTTAATTDASSSSSGGSSGSTGSTGTTGSTGDSSSGGSSGSTSTGGSTGGSSGSTGGSTG